MLYMKCYEVKEFLLMLRHNNDITVSIKQRKMCLDRNN